jgi:hypothetical protein
MMDTAEIFVTAGGITMIVATLWFFFGKREEKVVTTSSEALYACPMHPWITSNNPTAMCSICGMKLTKNN